jgi:acetylornithine deacetylase/succinyl-diaminopimelate desuccinylase-like protein
MAVSRNLGPGAMHETATERYVSKLVEYVGTRGVSSTGEGIAETVHHLVQLMEELGFATRLFQTRENSIVFASLGPDDASFTLLVYGHYDVFPVDAQDGWRTDPFTAVVDGDRIWGRGTGDNKGQHLAWLFGLADLAREPAGLPINVKVVIEGGEETGSVGLADFVAEHRELLSADLCCYSDGPLFPNDQPVLLLGVRGILCLEFVTRGASRSLHSGNFGGVAPNPATELTHCLASLADMTGALTVPGIEPDPVRLERDRPFLEHLPFDLRGVESTLGTSPISGNDPIQYWTNLISRSNLNISGIAAGYHGEGVRTIIPSEARAKVDIRLVGEQDLDHVYAAICDHVRQQGFSRTTVTRLVAQPSSRTEPSHPMVGHVKRSVDSAFGRSAMIVPSLGATTPDYLFTRVLGIPSVVVPLAPADQSNHGSNESGKLSLFLAGIRFVRALVGELGRASRTTPSDPASQEGRNR